MRKLLLLLTIVSVTGLMLSCSNENPSDGFVNIPDAEFNRYVLNKYDADRDGFLSKSEAVSIVSLDLRGEKGSDGIWQGLGIKSLEGVGDFPNLTSLYCGFNKLIQIDLRRNGLLRELSCEFNNLTSVNVAGCPRLQTINCQRNSINYLNLAQNTELRELNCDDNELAELNLSRNTELRTLSCFRSGLKSLDLTNNIELASLNCAGNMMSSLNLGKNNRLLTLICSYNSIAELNLDACARLEVLECKSNKLSNMLDLSANPLLVSVDCSENKGLRYLLLREGQTVADITKDADTEILYRPQNMD